MARVVALIGLVLLVALAAARFVHDDSRAATPTAPRLVDDGRALALAVPKESAAVDRDIVALQRVAAARPGSPDAWLLLGQAWVRKARETSDPGFYLNANATADVLLELAPGSSSGCNLQALVLLNQHRFREARELAQAVLDEDPGSAMAWGSLSDAALELGDDRQALEAASAMLALKPNLPSYSRISYLQWLRGDTRAALDSIRLAIDAAGDQRDREPRAWALVQAAFLFWHQGDYAGADAGFEQALQVWSNYAPALIGRGRVALAQGDLQRAAAWFGSALEATPSAEAAWLLSAAQRLSGNVPAAHEAVERSHREGRRGDSRALALIYASQGRELAEAVRLARAEKNQRGDIYTDDALAWASFKAGNLAEARQASERALRLGTKDARLLFHRGAILLASGDAAGRSLVAEALHLNPAFDPLEALEAKELLAAR